MRRLALALVCIVTAGAYLFAQQPPVTFKAEVGYVDVDAVVTDQQGNFVSNLNAGDFQIFEDGKPQKIALFSHVDLASPRAQANRPDRLVIDGRTVTDDVRSNQQAAATRLYVIVLDDLNTSFFRTGTVRQTARRFVEQHLAHNDVAAVVYTSGRADASQEFTSDPSLLLASVDKFVGRKLRSATLDKIDSYYQQQELSAFASARRDAGSGPAPINSGSASAGSSTDPGINPYTRGDGYPDRTFDSEDLERGYRAIRVLDELKNLADFMGNIRGRRKALLLFSEGIDYATNDIFGAHNAGDVIRATQDAITAAARGNVSVFGVDPRGLVGMSPDAVALDSPGLSGDSMVTAGHLSGFAAEMRLSQDSLRTLAEETGGFATVGANNPAATFDRIVRANSTYYVLGYYPPNHPRDGRFHKIEVRVNRPGLRVVARKGYASPRGKTPEERARDERAREARQKRKGGADTTTTELREILNSPMQQQGGVPMLVHAAAFKAAAGAAGASKTVTPVEHSVALAIEIDSGQFQFQARQATEARGTVYADTLELSYFSINERGTPLRGERRAIELSLRPETYKRVRHAGLRINERLALAPGRYQIRIGARETGASAMGTVFYDLVVPDFSKERLSMSGILLTAGSSQTVPTFVSDKTVPAESLPGPATSRRTFARGDVVAVYAELYDNVPPRQAHTLDLVTRLVGQDGGSVFTSREHYDAAALRAGGASTTLGISKHIPLDNVAAGTYVLQVVATPMGNTEGVKPIIRETVLTVVP
ncbi:MAG TPA: VWA domain-containing protein [Vicinamibacterales bacterium]|nr:VWA domain-containing protein [Vicinamibacterales bacterium]